MYLVVHATVGSAIGDYWNLPIISFLAGLLSHFILDIIPHGDERSGRVLLKTGRLRWIIVLALADGLAALSLIMILWAGGFYSNVIGAVSGAVGAILPDVLVGLSELWRGKLWHGLAPLESSPMHEENVIDRISIPSATSRSASGFHFLTGFNRFHEWNHKLINIELPLYFGGAIQAAVLLAALRILGLVLF